MLLTRIVHANPRIDTNKNRLYCRAVGCDLKLHRPLAQYENMFAMTNAMVLASGGLNSPNSIRKMTTPV